MSGINAEGQAPIAAGVNDKDEQGLTALHRAAGLGHPGAVGRLLAHGADPTILDNRTGASPLHHAASRAASRSRACSSAPALS